MTERPPRPSSIAPRPLGLGLGLGLWLGLGLAACADEALAPHPGEALAGGALTVHDEGARAFTHPGPSISDDHESAFYVGNSFFNKNWVMAPASTTARDGLGPTFNANSCSGCHFRDGRGRPPLDEAEPMLSMLVRLSVPGTDANGGPMPEPNYGGQLQPEAIMGVTPEGRAIVSWEERPGTYADGSPYSLRAPTLRFEDLAYGPLDPETMTSARVAPVMIGLGLLEVVGEADILAAADPEDADGDGISGRANRVWDPAQADMVLGRFGWKANQGSLRAQNAGAFLGDIGITSSLHPEQNCTAAQGDCLDAMTGGEPELDDSLLDDITAYSQLLAVPARRRVDAPEVLRGRERFTDLGCASCHRPRLQTASDAGFDELRAQTIWPYTDLLLHDMGEGLADGRPDGLADGNEWRTPPLWGIGLVEVVNQHTNFLHDGRARSLEEAILWHGGEAESARALFVELSAEDRADLLAFLESL